MRRNGFSLIQLIADGFVLTTLILLVFILVNPVGIYMKAKDQSNLNDVAMIKQALGLYYSDHSCYPSSLPFGKKWAVGNKVYMEHTPQHPLCASNPANCYLYQVNTEDACAQWNVLYARVNHTDNKGSCNLKVHQAACLPLNYDDSWACDATGVVDCGYVAASTLLSPLQNRLDIQLASYLTH